MTDTPESAPPILTTTQVEPEPRTMLDYNKLQPISDPWECSTLYALCEEHTSWKELAAVYYERGYMQTMRPEVTAKIALLTALDVPPVVVTEVGTQRPDEAFGNARRGIERRR